MTYDTSNTSGKPGCAHPLLTLLTALLAVVAAGTAVQALTLPAELAAQVSVVLPVEVIAGGLWAGLFTLITWRLLRNTRRAARLAAWTFLGFAAYSVIRLLLFARADYDAGRLPFLLVTLGIILVAAGFLRAVAPWRHT
jgi:hypothetical protein